MSKTLHIISFDYPYPPDYGGIIDVFYKLKALRHQGINVILHYFADEKKDFVELDALCEKVYFYPKSSVFSSKIFSDTPLRMFVRSSKAILPNLLKDDHPILFEGLHTSYIASAPELKDRKKYLRCHNAEAEYAANLARSEENYIKKKTFEVEAARTEKAEKDLNHFTGLFVLSEKDAAYFSNSNENVLLLPVFHQDNGIEEPEDLGNYILFHGNLSISENAVTASWLAHEIASKFWDFNFVIAGKDPSAKLLKELDEQNVRCVPNPSQYQMDTLIRESQIIILRTEVPSGIKLKLVDSLAKGRHVIADSNTILSSNLESLVHEANSNDEVIKLIRNLMHKMPDPQMVYERSKIFSQLLNNEKNARKIIEEIF